MNNQGSLVARRLFFLVVIFAITVSFVPSAGAQMFVNEPVRTIVDGAAPWAKIECLKDEGAGFVREPFHENGKQTHSVVRKAFDSDTPDSRYFLLHYAPLWDKSTKKTPVLLVHGAGSQAFHSWCHPYLIEAPDGSNIEKPGLMKYLTERGYSVFAITFSHPHGDNFLQAQQLANAIGRIKSVLKGGPDFKVDIVCHSKGAMPARIYLSSLGEEVAEYSWLTPYRGDVRKCVFVASPLKGIDTQYRYYAYNLTVLMKDIAAPMAPEWIIYLGACQRLEGYNDKFPGQAQMLHNWVEDGIDFDRQSVTTDLNATRNALYYGGTTALLKSAGIDAAIKRSGNVIEKLCARGVAPGVVCSILAGTKQDIDHVSIGMWNIPVGEFADSSDGVLFYKSATYAAGLTARGAKVARIGTFKFHHVGLIFWPDALKFIEGELSGRNTH